ncbi:Ribosomal protein S13 mitochondrial [Bienertia sinuspersici]
MRVPWPGFISIDHALRVSYISGARLADDKQVKIASTKIDGIGPKKAIQIDKIEKMIGQDHVIHWELKRGEREDIK